MKVAVFFTFDYSLKTWDESGTLNRELKIYKKLKELYGVKFVFLTYGNENDLRYNKIINEFEIIPIYTITKQNKNKIFRFLNSILIPLKLKNILKDVDIFHQHQLLGAWVPLLAKILYKKPLLIRTGYDMELFAKYENKPTYLKICYKVLNYISIKFSNLYTVASKSDFKRVKNKFKDKEVAIRPNWVQTNEYFSELNERYPKNILCVGRLEKQKNFEHIIREFSGTNKDLSIDIVGQGSLKNKLIRSAKEKNVKLNFLGNINYEDLILLYQNYLFFISSSKFEGNPKTVLEAMGSGCVVLASNIPNHSEIIQNEKNGILFDMNHSNLRNKYYEILNNKDKLQEISKNAKLHIEKNNNIEDLAECMFKDYKKIIS